jgi:hypothetical protein
MKKIIIAAVLLIVVAIGGLYTVNGGSKMFTGALTKVGLIKDKSASSNAYTYYIYEINESSETKLGQRTGKNLASDLFRIVRLIDRRFGSEIAKVPGLTDSFREHGGKFMPSGFSDDRNAVAEQFGGSRTGMYAAGGGIIPDFNGGMITIGGNFGSGGVSNVEIGFDLLNVNPAQGRVSTVAGISNEDIDQLSNTIRNMFADTPGTVGETFNPNNNPDTNNNQSTTVADNNVQTVKDLAEPNEPQYVDSKQPAKNDEDSKKPSKDPNGSDSGKGMVNPDDDRAYGSPNSASDLGLRIISSRDAQSRPGLYQDSPKVDASTEASLRGVANLDAARGNPGRENETARGAGLVNFVLNIDCARSVDLCGSSTAQNIVVIAIPANPQGGGLGNPGR